jgi:hypothetical protein
VLTRRGARAAAARACRRGDERRHERRAESGGGEVPARHDEVRRAGDRPRAVRHERAEADAEQSAEAGDEQRPTCDERAPAAGVALVSCASQWSSQRASSAWKIID